VTPRSESRLSRLESWALPLIEVSGLTLRGLPLGATELIAVSDEDFDVVSLELDGKGRPREAAQHPLWRQLPDDVRSGTGGSEFEGVACDGEGLTFILQEGPARVLVVSRDFDELHQTINLRVEPDQPGFGSQWHAERAASNARGESLTLLRGGRLLVVKQREPVQFIEFGPVSAVAHGFGRHAYLRPNERFDSQPGRAADLVVLGSWPLHPDSADGFDGVNDVAVGDDERLYILSSRSRRIGRLERQVQPDEPSVRVSDEWKLPEGLPGGEDGRPEGLALLPNLVPLVSIDTKAPGDNLVRLEQLSP
jgi:hypothetical protein